MENSSPLQYCLDKQHPLSPCSSASPFPLRLSQGHLNLLQTCPPQFQRVYLEQLTSPISPQQQEKITWGNQFHLLMQQRELGLPIEALVSNREELKTALFSLLDRAPEIADLQAGTWREAEHPRSLTLEGYLLTAIYDLLICYPDEAKIFDWKTYLKPEKPQKLAQNWQTRLYMYILSETSAYFPQQISLTYWFVRGNPQSLTFTYSQTQHQQTDQELKKILRLLGDYLRDYENNNLDFPHSNNCQQTCPYAPIFSDSQLIWPKNPDLTEMALSALEEVEEVNPFIV